MRTLPFPFATALLCIAFFPLAHASPLSVEQGRASQRAGTKLVDIYYDISGGVAPYTVSLQGSLDGGVTWTLPVASVSGNVGSVSTAGSNRVLTWNADADWSGQVSNTVKFRVNVTDSATPPAPDGFARIPAGEFLMGDQSNPKVGYSGELPVHTVYVSAFYMAKYETTKELWDSVRAWGMSNGHGYTDLAVGNGGYASKGANHPVHSITWYDMVKWCNARSEMENLVPCYTVSGATYKTGSSDTVACNWSANGYRLPSEAEWEKAARGGQTGKNFPWGDTIGHSKANYFSSSFSYEDDPKNQGFHPDYTAGGYPYSAPVDSFAPNGYGLYNMAGNMWEWCWDCYGSYAAGSQADPYGAVSGTLRVFRGGSWGNYANYCRVALRHSGYPAYSYYGVGFRIARSSVP